MAYTNKKFCWYGISSTDVERVAAFYGEALGWTIEEVQMGGDTMKLASVGGKQLAHIAAPGDRDLPRGWENYLRVEDVDAATQAAVQNGGKALVPPTDIPPGRFSGVAAPSGAVLYLFEPSGSQEDPPAGPGAIHWVELNSHDLEADVAWMTRTFDLSAESMDMPNGPYTVFKDGESMVGGAKTAHPEAPSLWLTWVQVDDLDATLGRITRGGGRQLSEVMDIETVGRMAVVADPTRGAFGVIVPAENG